MPSRKPPNFTHTHTLFLDCAWTSWFDRDNPSGTGDYENPLSSLGTGTCTNPLNIEGRR